MFVVSREYAAIYVHRRNPSTNEMVVILKERFEIRVHVEYQESGGAKTILTEENQLAVSRLAVDNS